MPMKGFAPGQSETILECQCQLRVLLTESYQTLFTPTEFHTIAYIFTATFQIEL